MTIIGIITFLIANRAAIGELVKLIQDLLERFNGDTAVAMSDETVSAMAVEYPALAEMAAVEGKSFMDLVKFIIDNREAIIDLVNMIRDLFKPAT